MTEEREPVDVLPDGTPVFGNVPFEDPPVETIVGELDPELKALQQSREQRMKDHALERAGDFARRAAPPTFGGAHPAAVGPYEHHIWDNPEGWAHCKRCGVAAAPGDARVGQCGGYMGAPVPVAAPQPQTSTIPTSALPPGFAVPGLAVRQRPIDRALDALLEHTRDLLASDSPWRFRKLGALSQVLEGLRIEAVTRAGDVGPARSGAIPVYGPGLGPIHNYMHPEDDPYAAAPAGAPGAGENDFASMMRELMMTLGKQSEQATEKNLRDAERWQRVDDSHELEQLLRLMKDGIAPPAVEARVKVLLSRLEALNADDPLVHSELPRRHPSDGKGSEDDDGRVGEAVDGGDASARESQQEV
jgi:hypothetical protein